MPMNDIQPKGKKVYLALSGGVDSSVSAALLKEQGYDVTGIFMKNWSGDDYGLQADCPWEEDQADAEAVCKHLGIEFRSVNFEKEYREKVVEYFFSEYEKGRTPNPDVMCNKEIKFKLFFEKALAQGFDYIATGHYARIERQEIRNKKQDKRYTIYENTPNHQSPITNHSKNEFRLLKGIDENKDQTYFIYNLRQEHLSRTFFPVGHLQKSEVRELARKFKLPNAEKPDSQGICFIGEINVMKFLMSRLPEKKGDFIDIDSGEKVGEHKGVYFYTIGQRAGIGGQSIPYFIVDKDLDKNVVYIGHGHDHPKMFKQKLELENLHLTNENYLQDILEITDLEAAVRYRQKPEAGSLKFESDKYFFQFEKPVRAPASGQSLVIYRGEECIGGGVIK